MTIQQLRFFQMVCQHRHFTSAANELYISQSSLSKQIIALEKELGAKLFERDTRNFALTPAGERILERVNRILGEYEQMIRDVSAQHQPGEKRVAIGAVPILNHYGITEQLLRFQKLHEDIVFHISETVTADVFDMLDRRKIDMGIIRTSYLQDSYYELLPILEDELILLVSEKHHLANSSEISCEMLADEHFMLMDTDPYYTQFYRKLLRDGNIQPTIEYTKMRLETIKMCVAENTCVSLMMRQVAQYPTLFPGTKILYFKQHPSLYLVIASLKGSLLTAEALRLRTFLLQS